MAEIQDYHYQGSMKDDPKRKLNSFFTKFGSRKVGGLIATLVLAIMLPVTLIALQEQQIFKQQASEEWSEVITVEGQVGKDAAGKYYAPALVSYNGKLYAFVIGQGQEKCPVQDTNDPNCNRSEWYNVYVTSSDSPEESWDTLKNLGGNASSPPIAMVSGEQLGVTVQGYDSSTPSGSSMYYQTVRTSTQDFASFPGSWTAATQPESPVSTRVNFNGTEYIADTETGKLRLLRRN